MRTVGCLLLLWGLSALLAAGLQGGSITGTDATSSISEQLFGSARTLIGQRMVIEADRYFHQGVGHTADRFTLSKVMTQWSDAIAPKEHTVLSGGDLEEIMPWFRFATKLDPENVDAYVSAAYWCMRSGHADRAQKILSEALQCNPHDFSVHLAMGHALRHSGLTATAESSYLDALNAWSPETCDNERAARVQMLEALLSLGSLYEDEGDVDKAIDCYTSLIKRYPGRKGMTERIAALKRGETLASNSFWGGSTGLDQCSHGCSHDHGQDEACDHDHEAEGSDLVLSQTPHACSDECIHEH